jgi:hypothetical protein
LWTPGYWAWGGNAYFFHEGYWGPQVGFYGGINYGYGYFGRGYEGGRWDRGHFYYNRSVNNVNVTEIHNVYNTTIVNRNEKRVSYNGGRGGITERANDREEAAARERHIGAIAAQNQQVQEARTNRELRASKNHGKPPIAATQRPGAFSGGGVVPAREGGNYNPPPNRGGGTGVHNNERTNAENNAARPNGGNNNANRPNNGTERTMITGPIAANRPPTCINELPPMNRSDRPPSGNPKTDQISTAAGQDVSEAAAGPPEATEPGPGASENATTAGHQARNNSRNSAINSRRSRWSRDILNNNRRWSRSNSLSSNRTRLTNRARRNRTVMGNRKSGWRTSAETESGRAKCSATFLLVGHGART